MHAFKDKNPTRLRTNGLNVCTESLTTAFIFHRVLSGLCFAYIINDNQGRGNETHVFSSQILIEFFVVTESGIENVIPNIMWCTVNDACTILLCLAFIHVHLLLRKSEPPRARAELCR